MLANPTLETLEASAASHSKKTLTKSQRGFRCFLSALDPRAWLHLLKLVNYYNYTHVTPKRAMQIGRNAAISPTVSFANAHNIFIGNNAHLGAGCSIWAGSAHGTIRTGDNLLLGPGVVITASNYRFNDGHPVTQQLMEDRPIHIGEDVWIGANATILPGAQIEDGAIIAAGAVVTGKVEKDQIVAGVPAKRIGDRFQD